MCPARLAPEGSWRVDVDWWLRTSTMKELRLQVHSDELEDVSAWLLQECPRTLQSLELSFSEFSPGLLRALAGSRLRRLRIWSSEISEECGEYLAALLEANTYLRELELVQDAIDSGAAEFIAAAVARSGHLSSFVLAHNDVELHGLQVLAEAAAVAKCETRSCGRVS
mmetsp:Transcript_17954/g.54538  ORF Transcript_17954/g.54538 Transcript_17954/m.54538 type:complete len:168 (+) Transcript_17954:70-573(+)